jgi:hypothetical protein
MEQSVSTEVVRRILQCLLPVLDKHVLVLFTGGSADAESLMDTVESLLATRAAIAVSPTFTLLAPRSFLDRIEDRLVHDESMLRHFIANAHLTVVPIMTRNTLVKAALGIQDSIVTNAIAATLMRGIPLIAINENCHPQGAHSLEKGLSANSAYNTLLMDYERKLEALGATMVAGSEFAASVKKTLYPGVFRSQASPSAHGPSWRFSGGSVLTRADIPSLPQGSILEVPATAVITPLAMEQIERQQLVVVRPSCKKEDYHYDIHV